MYGKGYIDWLDRRQAERALEAFIAGLPAHLRPYVETILRERYDKQRASASFAQSLAAQQKQAQFLPRPAASHGSILDLLGRPFG